jgi:hypothetical protein
MSNVSIVGFPLRLERKGTKVPFLLATFIEWSICP